MAKLQDICVDFVSLVDRAAVRDPQQKSEPRQFLFWKSEGHQDKESHMTDQEMQAAIDKAEQDKAEAETARDAALKAQKDAETERDALKAESEEVEDEDEATKRKKAEAEINKDELPEAVRKALEKAEQAEQDAQTRIEKAEKDAADAAAIAKAERNERITSEFIKKAEGYRALSIKPTEFGPVLKRAQETLTKEDFEALDTLLSAVDEQLVKSELFAETGTSKNGPAGTALAEAQARASELQKADPNLSPAEALGKAMASDPDLQRRYYAEVR